MEAEEAQFAQPHGRWCTRRRTAAARWPTASRAREAREERVRQLASELESLKQRAERRSAELMGLRGEGRRRQRARRVARAELERLIAPAGRSRGASTAWRDGARGHARRSRAARTIDEAAAPGRAEEHHAARRRARRAPHAHAAVTAEVREQDAELRELRGKLDELTQGLSQMSLRERELGDLELQHLTDGIARAAPGRAGARAARPPPAARSSARRGGQALKELRDLIERMGEINLTAIEEYKELEKRYTSSSTQKADLETALDAARGGDREDQQDSREALPRGVRRW